MDKELERAYDALMQADAAGNKEDAQQIADYIRTLEAQQNVPAGKTSVEQVSDEDLVNVLTPTIGGAIAGEIVGPIVNKGVEAVQAGKAPTTTTAPAARAAGTPFNPRGVTIEQSVQNWENYGQAQNEAAKRVRREAELHKKYPGFTRAQPPAPPPASPSGMAQLRAAIPGPVKTAGQFLGGATQSGVVPWLGRALAGGAAGYQGADAYNRLRQGDMVGGGLSAIGTLGAGASFFPHPAARYGGAAISAGAEGLNQYLDYLKRKTQQPAAAQPQQEQQMPVPMKEGGLVHLAGGKRALVEEGGSKIMEILKNKMAPLYAKSEGIPARLPRATPKTDAELFEFAQRMAPQVRGDFVTAPGKTTSVAGKTRAQFEREKGLQHDIRDVPGLTLKPSNYNEAAHQNKVKIGIAGDQTPTGKDVYAIAGNPLSSPSRQYGGALYPAAHPLGWASEKEAAQGVQNLVNTAAKQYGDVDVLGEFMKMGPEANNYAMHNADAIIKSINPAQIKQLDDLNRMIRAKFPDFAGIENQAEILKQAEQNPELRKFLDYLVITKKHAETYGLPSGADMRHALSEPDLRNLEIGASGKSVIEMVPGGKISPSSRKTTTTYSHDIPGEYLGGTKYARPYQLEFADSYLALQNKIGTVQDLAKQAVLENPNLDPQAAIQYAKKYANQGFGGFRLAQPRQIMDQQYMDETGKYEDYMKQLLGFKEGGAIQNFDGGGKAGVLPKVAKHSISQYKKIAEALEEYLKGNITKQQQMAVTRQYLPIRQWSELPPEYTDEQIINALSSNQLNKALAPVPVGKETGNRLDINAYTKNNPPVFVDTVHDINDKNKVISYNRTGHLRDVDFKSLPNSAVLMGLGTKEQALTPMGAQMGKSKAPIAMIRGTNVGTSDNEVRRMMAEMLNDPNYTQIGMDPRVGSQFYDKATDRPIWTSGEKFQIGPLVMVPKKDIEVTDWLDPRLELKDFPGKRFKEGGSTTPAWQRSEGKSPSGGLNALGRASYKRETGGELKAPQPEGGSRKKSFCARMGGMKKKLTSSKTANDPDSRINKALRKWKC
jgi:hypothetical protein